MESGRVGQGHSNGQGHRQHEGPSQGQAVPLSQFGQPRDSVCSFQTEAMECQLLEASNGGAGSSSQMPGKRQLVFFWLPVVSCIVCIVCVLSMVIIVFTFKHGPQQQQQQQQYQQLQVQEQPEPHQNTNQYHHRETMYPVNHSISNHASEESNKQLQMQILQLNKTAEESKHLIETLLAGQTKINKTVHQNQKYIAAAQRRMNLDCLYREPHFNKTEEIVKLDCGGNITLPPPGGSVLLDYKSTDLYDNNERCLWVLDSATNGKRFDAKLKVSIQCEGFGDSDDVVSVLDWIDWDSLTTYELKNNAIEYVTHKKSSWHYLSFTSNNKVTGNGFILRVDVILLTQHYADYGLNEAFTSLAGVAEYGPNRNNSHVSIVINPHKHLAHNNSEKGKSQAAEKTTLTVEYLESKRSKPTGPCDGFDTMYVFQVGQKGSNKKLASLCGNVSSRTFESQDPFLVGFTTSSSTTSGRGFRLSWK